MLLKGRPCWPWPGPAGAPGVRAWEWGGRWPRHVHPRGQGGPDRLRLELEPEVCAVAQAQAPGRRERSSESMFQQRERTWPQGRVGRSLEVVPQAPVCPPQVRVQQPQKRGEPSKAGRAGASGPPVPAGWGVGGAVKLSLLPPGWGSSPGHRCFFVRAELSLLGSLWNKAPLSKPCLPTRSTTAQEGAEPRAPIWRTHQAQPQLEAGVVVLPAQGWAHSGSPMKGVGPRQSHAREACATSPWACHSPV